MSWIKTLCLRLSKPILLAVPTTPNPTSGFLLMVPNTELKKLNVSVDDAIKTIVSAGIIKLESKRNKNS